MRWRLDLVATLVHDPKVLFLDEPATGLDPQSRMTVWDHVRRLNEEKGVTIILTTRMMDEADRLCGRLAIIDGGKIVAEGSPRSLKEEVGGDVVTISVTEPDDAAARDALIMKEESLVAEETFVSAVSLNPVTCVIEAIREIVVSGRVWESTLPGLAILVGMNASLLAVTTWMYPRVAA